MEHPELPMATREVWVVASAFYPRNQPKAAGDVALTLKAMKGRPAAVHVHLAGHRVGDLNAKNAAYLTPLIRALAPDDSIVSTSGVVTDPGLDDGRLVIMALVPTEPSVLGLLEDHAMPS